MKEIKDNIYSLLCSKEPSYQLLGVQLAHSQLNREDRISIAEKWIQLFNGKPLSSSLYFPLWENGKEITKSDYVFGIGILSDILEDLTMRGIKKGEEPHSISYLKNLKKLTLENCMGIEMLEDCDFPKLKECRITNSPLINSSRYFDNFKNLEILEISKCGLKDLDGFENLTKIRRLFLESDRIIDWERAFEILSKLKKLDFLFVFDSACSHIGDGISKLKSLKVLNWSAPGPYFDCNVRKSFGNCLLSVSEEIGKLTKLEELYFNKQSIQYLPESIGKLKNLKKLDLSHTKVETLPKSISGLKNLEILHLYYSSIRFLPEEIGELKKLKKLSLNETLLNDIPPALGNLRQLEMLKISRFSSDKSALQSNLSWIGRLKKLKDLELTNLDIRELPASLSKLQKLEKFSAKFNKIRNIVVICKLKSLKILSLDHNSIYAVPNDISGLTELTVFSASVNNIKRIATEFYSLKKLEKVNLAHNRIEKYDFRAAKHKSIKSLNLNFNRIKAFSVEIRKFTKLYEFKCIHNPVKKMPLDTILEMKQLYLMHLSKGNYSAEKISEFREKLRKQFRNNLRIE